MIERENVFIAFRRYDILKDNGRISHKQAVEKAYQEYDIFNKTQPIESDFDKIVKGLEKKNNYFSGLCDYDTIMENSVL